MNEVEASEDPTRMFVPHPEVIEYSKKEGKLVLENLGDVSTVKDYLEDDGDQYAEELGEMIGRLIADIHRFGSHGDPELDNFVYEDGDIATLDHEFYTSEPEIEDLRGDIRLIESDARTLDSPVYHNFMEKFEEAYLEDLRTGEENPKLEEPFTEAENQMPEPATAEKPLKILEGLIRTKKRHEELDIGLVLGRSGNLFKNSLRPKNQ